MQPDDADDDIVEPHVPERRRSTYTPPVRGIVSANEVAVGPETHDDDELASALEQEVSRYARASGPASADEGDDGEAGAGSEPISATSDDLGTAPLEAVPDAAGSLNAATSETRTAPPADGATEDDTITKLIDADVASGDTLGAIEKLEEVLAARTAAIPLPGFADPDHVASPSGLPPAPAADPAPVALAPDQPPTPADLPLAPEDRPATTMLPFDAVLAPAPDDRAQPPFATIPRAVPDRRLAVPTETHAGRERRVFWWWLAAAVAVVVIGVAAVIYFAVII